MKTIKFIFWVIILALLGTLIYQNRAYFITTTTLDLDLKITGWKWTIPPVQNIAYFGICFLLGLILAGIKGFFVYFGLKKQIKNKNKTIAGLQKEIDILKTELHVFKHDPYIKKEIENTDDGVYNSQEALPATQDREE
ncbi:MAG: hypothetical protein A2277_07330 [Desulfobacterales bacterium RIFOXYA12_FULL_46_15]|nr:MAG: hypothetical protein A2097_02160 [Desulfobacula sp. GWF2_41_7]OGR28466.1 MAG: hypothetical protein A2277_07330 [Desulfobacterales bacterium RIFOXYA12_FULL_46_15]